MSAPAPAVGRAVWMWAGAGSPNVMDSRQPFEARVCFVHPDGKVSVTFNDHHGFPGRATSIDLLLPQMAPNPLRPLPAHPLEVYDAHGIHADDYATWMPYQVRQGAGGSS